MSQHALWFTQPLDKIDLHVKHAACMQNEPTKVQWIEYKRITQWPCVVDKQRGMILYIFGFRCPHSLNILNTVKGILNINQWALCLVSDLGWLSNQFPSRGYISPSSAELRKCCTIQTGLCVLSVVWEAVGFSIIACERREALYNYEKVTQGAFLFIPWEATQMCMHAVRLGAHTYTHTQSSLRERGGKFWLAAEVGQEVIMALKNTALVSTSFPNLCWDIPNSLPEQKSTHKHTTVRIYADEHT